MNNAYLPISHLFFLLTINNHYIAIAPPPSPLITPVLFVSSLLHSQSITSFHRMNTHIIYSARMHTCTRVHMCPQSYLTCHVHIPFCSTYIFFFFFFLILYGGLLAGVSFPTSLYIINPLALSLTLSPFALGL